MNTCHTCGLPSDCTEGSGRKITIRIEPQSRFHRASRRTVWCHSDECVYQAMAIAKYGSVSHKWPVTLVQFRAMNPLPTGQGSGRPEIPSELVENAGADNGLPEFLGLPDQEPISGRKTIVKRRAGRPRQWASEAERKRAYRQRVGARQ